MRTLTTQMRLRRLLRAQAEYQQRLRGEGPVSTLAAAGSGRLLHLLADVRAAWGREGEGLAVPDLRAHVSRSLAAMGAAAAAMAVPGADLARLDAEFRDVGLPLLFFLRGLDDSEAAVLAELGGRSLLRSA
ncbi:MAG TPA: hypothetical protein VKF59_23505 [Candidatus Dormibacteraeota bacterium]|nr:hypothetical protein [Candidatus Dormibacteraeota bacterium]